MIDKVRESCKINRLWMYKTENTFLVLVTRKIISLHTYKQVKFYKKKKNEENK